MKFHEMKFIQTGQAVVKSVAVVHDYVGGFPIDGHPFIVDAFDLLPALLSQQRSLFGPDVQHDVVDGAVDQHNDPVIFH